MGWPVWLHYRIAHPEAKITLANLVYNIDRLIFYERQAVMDSRVRRRYFPAQSAEILLKAVTAEQDAVFAPQSAPRRYVDVSAQPVAARSGLAREAERNPPVRHATASLVCHRCACLLTLARLLPVRRLRGTIFAWRPAQG